MGKHYCCEEMKDADEKGIIDYCPSGMTTIDFPKVCYPINYCPFCGKILKRTKRSVDRIKKYFGVKKGERR